MCLRPIKIRNKSLTIGCSDYTPYSLEVPCMDCAECKALIRDQWYLRAYWQAKYTFDQNGYVLFDTLTYADHSLPHIGDYIPEFKNSILNFPCFSREHVRRFFIDLRQDLSRAGYSPKDNIKYFLCSEYGTSPNGTNRPHYHLLIYVTDPKLAPEVLSAHISKAWKYGRTDGIPYQSQGYVINGRVFGPRYNSDSTSMQAATGYVMKYITKDSDFESRIKYRLNLIMDKLCQDKYRGEENPRWFDFPEFKARYREVKRYISQFHRQSQHFGEYALSQYDIQSIMHDGTMEIPDKDTVVKHIPIPMYYSRKLFCTQVKMDDGRRVWIPTELGKRYRYRRTYMSAARMCRRLQDWESNIDIDFVNSDTVLRLPDGSEVQFDALSCFQAKNALRTEILRLLRGRGWLDVATYACFYRGRVIPRENLIDPHFLRPMDVVSSQLSADPRHTQNVYRYRVYVDQVTGEEVPMMSLVGDDKFMEKAEARHRGRTFDVDVITVDVFKKHMLVNDSTYSQFQGFDELLDLYELCMKVKNRRKQQAFDITERTQKVLSYFRKNS